MKHKLSGGWITVLMVLVMAVLALTLVSPPAQAQTTSGGITYGTFSSIGATMPASTTSNITSGAILVRQNRGLALLTTLAITGNPVGTVTYKFDVSVDGTTYTTTKPLAWVVDGGATNSSGVCVSYTNVPSTYLNNVRWIRPSVFINGSTNALTGVSLIYSYSNTP